jgi:hypothetical protein
MFITLAPGGWWYVASPTNIRLSFKQLLVTNHSDVNFTYTFGIKAEQFLRR